MARSAFGSALGRMFGRMPDDPRYGRRWRLPLQAGGVTVSHEIFMQYSVAWACVKVIAESLACSKWRVFQREGGKNIHLEDDPLDWMLNVRANPETTAIAAKEVLIAHAATSGNGYAEIQRDRSGRVISLWPISFDRVTPERLDLNPDGPLVYRVLRPDGVEVILQQEDVFHLRGPCSVTSLMGDNLVARAAKSAALGLAAERWGAAFYANGTEIGTVLKYPKALPKDKHDQLLKEWEDWHAGPDRAHRTVILENGMDLTSAASNRGEYDPVKDRKFQLEEIARYFSVPQHKIGHLERATYNNIEHLGLEFTRDTLTPWTERLEQEANYKLIPFRQPKVTKIDTEWLSHGDAVSRATFYEKLHNIGVLSANDIRKREGMNTLGKVGDLRYVMMNYTTAEGIQAQVDKTNLENEQLRMGAPDPTPTLVDPPADDSASFGGGSANAKLPAGTVLALPAETAQPPAPTIDADAREALRGSVHASLTSSLARYGRRMTNRLAAHRKSSKNRQQIALAMVEERETARPGLVEELGQAMSFLQKYCIHTPSVGDFISAADSIDNGGDPSEVAKALIERATTDADKPVPGQTPGVQGGE